MLFANSCILFPYPPLTWCDAFTLLVNYQFNIACSQVTYIIIVQILDTDSPADFHFTFLHFSRFQDRTHGD